MRVLPSLAIALALSSASCQTPPKDTGPAVAPDDEKPTEATGKPKTKLKPASNACTPGKQEGCACPGGAQGTQVCTDDGSSFGPCDCPAPPKDTPATKPTSKSVADDAHCKEASASESPCTLADGRIGWCKGGRCKDICPPGMSYSPDDTACHSRCGKTCKNCRSNLCMDASAPVRP